MAWSASTQGVILIVGLPDLGGKDVLHGDGGEQAPWQHLLGVLQVLRFGEFEQTFAVSLTFCEAIFGVINSLDGLCL